MRDDDLLEPGETMVTTVHRTIVGLILIYLGGLVAIAAAVALLVVVAPDTLNDLSKQSNRLVIGLVAFGIAILVILVFVWSYVYRQNRLLVTNRSLVEVDQKSLFSRKISRLSFSNVEDVSASQQGILPTIFNYGLLVVQTAAERDQFVFEWCPKPNFYADRIIEAREAFAEDQNE